MADEQLLILKMLEDGKINAEQATELLTLTGQTHVSHTDSRSETQQLDRIVHEEARRARRQVKQQVRDESTRSIRHTGSARTIGSLERSAQKSLQLLGLPFGGSQSFAFSKQLSGRFESSGPQCTVHNTNGRITVTSSSDEEWHLTLKVRVRADNESAAKQRAESLISLEHSPVALHVQSARLFGQSSVSDIELQLPLNWGGELSVSCTNGTIDLGHFVGEQLSLKTVNGKILAADLQANAVVASSVNGGIEISGYAANITCRTANGRISLDVGVTKAARLDVQTVNGAINVLLPEQDDLGYCIDAESTAGGIELLLPDLVRKEHSRAARRQTKAKSRELKSKPTVQSVKARTVAGKISILGKGQV
jgi:DUF4097 and DUF4098 domain-containing protein YvlB